MQDKYAAQQDRTLIDRQSDEYAHSGTDDAVAAQPGSYTPSSPQDAVAEAAEEMQSISAAATETLVTNTSPLEASPANAELSGTVSEIEGTTGSGRAQAPPQYKTSVGNMQKSQSAVRVSDKIEKKKVFAGTDKRKDVMPGRETTEFQQDRGAGQTVQPGRR